MSVFGAAARGALVPGLLGLAALVACGPPAPRSVGSAAEHVRRPAPADTLPVFVAGGAPGNLLFRRGANQARLVFSNEQLSVTREEAFELLAAWRDPRGGAERSLGVGPNGPLIVEGGQAYELPEWPPGATAVSAAFTSNGRNLAIGLSGDNLPGPVGVWTIPPGPPRFLGQPGSAGARRFAWSLDGKCLILADAANELSIFRLPGSKAVYSQRYDPGSEGRIGAVDLSPDGDWFVVAANAVTVRAWKLPFMSAALQPWGKVKAVFFAGEVGSIVTVDETNTAIRWAVNYGDVRAAVSRHLDGMDVIRAPVAGQFFAGVDSAGILHAWRSGDLEPLQSSLGTAPFGR